MQNQATKIMNSFKNGAGNGRDKRYARYVGEDTLAFNNDKVSEDGEPQTVYLDTGDVVRDLRFADGCMSFSNGETVIITQDCNDPFVEITEHEYLSEAQAGLQLLTDLEVKALDKQIQEQAQQEQQTDKT